jgi:NADPH:quinone reductase-like Zn-dependent oxidoreductase
MNRVSVSGPESSPELVPTTGPEPRPGCGELLIQVRAAGVMSTELEWYPTWHSKSGGKRVAAVPCHEFSGVVAGVGEDAGSLKVGVEVFGMNDWYSDGAAADYCIAPYFSVVPKPSRLTDAEAASVPIGALTAWQALFVKADLQPGERVLIHGGAGAVGIFAVQLARLHGAHVIATASAANVSFVLSLGAHEVIDYRVSRFEDVAKKADVVLDTVGGETLERSWSILTPGGRLVTVVSSVANSTDQRAKDAFFIVEPNQEQLGVVAGLLQAGRLRPVVDAVVPLSRAADAFAGRVDRQGRGKIVFAVSSNGTVEGRL